MNNYVTGQMIKELREKNKMTQQELADIINVSDKTVSKWECGKGFPDISLIEPLSKALKVSIIELMNGKYIVNNNKMCDMLKTNFYVCPICENVIYSIGSSIVSCCGLVLPKLEAESSNQINIERIENEYHIKVKNEMTKEHHISFISYVSSDRVNLVKLYPEQNPEARFDIVGHGIIYIYCNKDGLFKKEI